MVVDADDPAAAAAAMARSTVYVVGPGLGREPWGLQLLEQALAGAKPLVLDADGLNLLAAAALRPGAPVIITPHAGEAGTLLGSDAASVMSDRPAAVAALAQRAAGPAPAVAVLKGAGTLLAYADPDGVRLLGVCGHGNSGMASAGMGDVLSGVIGGLLAQGLSVSAAAMTGVTAHSKAADLAVARTGERGLLATDLLPELMQLLA
jgi:NAD(P)H-hydrate epimerase